MKGNKWVLLVVVFLALFALACSSSDSDDDDDDDDDNVVDGDEDGDDTYVPPSESCDPECGTGYYCYKGFCEKMKCPSQCFPVEKDTDGDEEGEEEEEENVCPSGYVCEKQRDEDGMTDLSYCVKAICENDFDCQGGRCKDGKCRAPKSCVVDELAIYSAPGEPCEYNSMWLGSQCRPGDSCLGNYDITRCDGTATIQDDANNRTNSNSCMKSLGNRSGSFCDSNCMCGFAFCATPCMTGGRCIPNPIDPTDPLLPSVVSGSCYCLPLSQGGGDWDNQKSANIGQGCESGYGGDAIFPGIGCAGDGYCFDVVPADSVSERPTPTCSTVNDCLTSQAFSEILTYGGSAENVYCSASGHCGFSFCMDFGNSDGTCPKVNGVQSYPWSANPSYCASAAMAKPFGTKQIGEDCGARDNKATTDSNLCDYYLTCKSKTSNTACEQDSDCLSQDYDPSNGHFGPNGFCYTTYDTNNPDEVTSKTCRAGYCAAPMVGGQCLETEINGQMTETKPVVDGTKYCTIDSPYAIEFGTRTWGQTCDLLTNNCMAGLFCKKYVQGPACNTDAECQSTTDGYGANGYCSDAGKCSFTVCAKACDGEGWCPAGDNVGQIDVFASAGIGQTSECLCAQAPIGNPASELCDNVCALDLECAAGQMCAFSSCMTKAEMEALVEEDSFKAGCDDQECCYDADCTDVLKKKLLDVACNNEWKCVTRQEVLVPVEEK